PGRRTVLVLGTFLILLLATAAAGAQSITWVSVSEGGSGNGGSGPSAVSDSGRFVAFRSTETDLVPGDTNSASDVFVKDTETGAIEVVSVSSNGTLGDGGSGESVDISADGRYVLFQSNAANLVPGDTNSSPDIFVHDRQTGDTSRVLQDDGDQSPGRAIDGSISGNGRYVAFTGAGFDEGSAANDWGVFVYDLQTESLERITDGANFLTTSATYADVDISDDGRYVAFTTGEFGQFDDVVLFDRNTDTYEIANPRIGNVRPQSAHPGDLSLSGNGRFVTFSTPDDNLVNGDPADTNDVFVYNADTDALERIAVGGTVSQDPLPVISADGRFVAFTDAVDAYGEANTRSDVVRYDRQTDVGTVVSVFNDGSAADSNSGSALTEQAISRDGRFGVIDTDVEFDSSDPGGGDFYIVDIEGELGTTPPGGDACSIQFDDVAASSTFANDICWLAEQGITRGCNPPVNDRFCPKDSVTRGQMAAFLVRALGYDDNGGGDLFIDDDGTTFENDIDRLGTAGVTRGCNPPANDRFCPSDDVTREQMAAFLRRALDT
ncbi:MAG: S-layer homology domain-containing protein, partial [Acidimicrobiia bacterium]